jgi:anti-sigma regulatory factor (Ser/Thr protein kinase)
MELILRFSLPRQPSSVHVVRSTIRHALLSMAVERDVVADVELALAESVTGVLDHAGSDEDYEVTAVIDEETCVIEVVDRHFGADASEVREDEDVEGRGLPLMRAVSDRVTVPRRDASGTTVRIEKRLR